jgi:hypothetical protein
MQRSALTSSLCLSICLAFGARAAVAASDGSDGPKSTFSLHPLGTTLLNLPGYHFFQFTYEYHPGPGRLSWAWDPVFLFVDKSEKDNPILRSYWVVPIVTPRWYFRQNAQGWFGGLKAGYIHYTLLNEDEPPTYSPAKLQKHDEKGYAAGEIGFKHDWSVVSLYASGQFGLAVGESFEEYSASGQPPERFTKLVATGFGQVNFGLGYRF